MILVYSNQLKLSSVHYNRKNDHNRLPKVIKRNKLSRMKCGYASSVASAKNLSSCTRFKGSLFQVAAVWLLLSVFSNASARANAALTVWEGEKRTQKPLRVLSSPCASDKKPCDYIYY